MQRKRYKIKTLKQGTDIKLLMFSDVHFKEGFPVKKLNQIIEAAEKQDPDYICIVGDLINDSNSIGDLEVLRGFLESLSRIAPIVMSFGNHDFLAMGQDKKWIYYVNEKYFSMLLGISKLHLIDNKHWIDNNIRFTGITMPFDYYERCHESLEYTKQYMDTIAPSVLEEPNNELYQILFFHSPISLLELEEKEGLDALKTTDLVLSGHLHGGVTPPLLEPIFRHKGIVGPFNLKERIVNPNYVRGHMQIRNLDAVISTGISKLNIPATDIILPPNINEITIERQNVLRKK